MRASLRPHELLGPFGTGVLADVEQHLHDVGVRAAVQRPLQRADGADDRRMHVGQRRRRDARGERRGVQLVIGVQHQRHVEGARRERRRPLPGQHVEEVRRVSQRRVGIDVPAAGGHAAPRRDERAELPRQADGLAVVGLRRSSVGVRIVVPEHRRERPQRVHAVHARQRLHGAQDRLGQRARGRQLRLQIAEFGPGRQPAVPQQVADFLERRAAFGVRQVVDVVAVIREHAAVAVEKADGGLAGDDVFQAGFGFRVDMPSRYFPRGDLAAPSRAGHRRRSAGRWTSVPCRGSRPGTAPGTAACRRCPFASA